MKYHIITYGCQMNKSDSERLAQKLENKGYKPAKNIKQADLIVINVCSVRQSAIDRVKSKIRQIRSHVGVPNSHIKIVLTGCVLKQDKMFFKNEVDEIWPPANISAKPKCSLAKTAYLPIMTGCNNFCSYCAVPYTRGREKSRPSGQIINQAKKLIENGYKEIILLGQNVNSYQGKLTFARLLEKINSLDGKFIIKFITSHPKDMSNELINVIAKGKKISKEIHLPIQSGDNQILKKMNRHYTVGGYKKLVKKILTKIPQAKISTDVIVGFPGETEKQFQNTVKLFKQIKFYQAYVAAYSPRAGTTAAKLKDDVPGQEKKRRKRILLNLIKQS